MVTILVDCVCCGKEYELEVPLDNHLQWRAGALIQDALPMLSPAERELLISGICPKCWDARTL